MFIGYLLITAGVKNGLFCYANLNCTECVCFLVGCSY